MWPWEHLAVGYLAYSLGVRALGRSPPSDGPVVALAVATQVPDLVDKSLSWGLGWFATGYAVGHSAFVAVPAGTVAVLAARRRGRRPLGVAVAVGYWSHLLSDVFDPLRRGDAPLVGRVLWPVSDPVPYETERGLRRGLAYLDGFLADLSAMDPASVAVLYLLLPAATVVLWLLDGAPGPAAAARAVGGVRRRLR